MSETKIERIGIPSCYKKFRCIDVACSDTCCAGWQVDVDAKSFAYYKTVDGVFGDYMRSVMVEGENGEGQFQLCENGRCPFLMDNGLCDMYGHLGEDSLCDTCTNYPRYLEDYGTLREVGLAFSCPEAARMMLESDLPMQFEECDITGAKETWEEAAKDIMNRMDEDSSNFMKQVMLDKNQMSDCEETRESILDGNQMSELVESTDSLANEQDVITAYIDTEEEFDQTYFDLLYKARNVAFKIAQNRRFSIQNRMLLYLDYATMLQEMMDQCEDDEAHTELAEVFAEVMESYCDETWLLKRLDTVKEIVSSWEEDAQGLLLYDEPVEREHMAYAFLPEYMAVLYQELNHCKREWGPMLEEAEEILHKNKTKEEYKAVVKEFESYMGNRMVEYEQLLSYYIFRYFCKSYFDDDIYGKAQLAVMAYLTVHELAVCHWIKQEKEYSKEDQEWLFHLYSRELEHSDETYDTFVDMLRTESMCNYEHLLAILMR